MPGHTEQDRRDALTLATWAQQNDISHVLFDLDGTICDTLNIFSEQLQKLYETLAEKVSVLSVVGWKQQFESIDNAYYIEFGVAKVRYKHSMDALQVQHGLSAEVADECRGLLSSIYTTPVDYLPNAERGLDIVNMAGLESYLVTHGDQEWTEDKIKWLKLDKHIKYDRVYVVPADGHKTSKSWEDATTQFGVDPEHCMVVGDNPVADMNATKDLVKHRFFVEGSNLQSMHYKQVEGNVFRIKDLAGIATVIQE